MADKIKEMEERLDRLEGRLKTTFLEVERRFEATKIEEPAIVNVEERIQEIEDLILLLQLELTKIKEKTGGEEFISIAGQPDLEERMKKMEEMLSSPIVAGVSAQAKPFVKDRLLESKIERLENKLEELSDAPSNSSALDELERRLERIESSRERSTSHYMAVSNSGLTQEIKRILES